MPKTPLLSAGVARRIGLHAGSIESQQSEEIMQILDRKIRYACAHGVNFVDYQILLLFQSEESELKLVASILKNLKSRGFRARYSTRRRTVRISWK